MDYVSKMEELETLWSDSFDLCKAMIESCKSGEQKLTGSILKELNQFIKQSVDFLRYREAEKAFSDEPENQTEEDEAMLRQMDEIEAQFAEEDAEEQGLKLPPEFPVVVDGE